ncbi:MAG: ABC transporter permease [Planctomycetes bacterium]|nr:ABC transporter permease [Planctomycetota bacterium]
MHRVLEYQQPATRNFSVKTFLYISLAFDVLLIIVLAAMGRVPLRYNLRNLVVRWRTTLLTAMAFTLVVSLMTVMLAFVNGMQQMTEQSGHPDNVIVLSDGATDEVFSNLGFADSSDIERQPGVRRDEEGRPLCSRETYVVVNQPIEGAQPGQPQRRFIQVRGIEDPQMAGRVHGLRLLSGGRWFSKSGVEPAPTDDAQPGAPLIQAVMGEGVARQWGMDHQRPPLDVGDVFSLGGRRWIVSGLIASEGSTFGSEVWAKRAIIAPMFGKETYSSITLRAESEASAKTLADDLTARFKKSAVQAKTELEYFSALAETSRQFLVAIIFVAVVMAIGGVFGVMNTMFAAISQRIKDIGVLRIIGYGRGQILMSFLLESLVLALIGGAIGCLIGSFADGLTARSIISSGQGSGKFVVLRLVVDSNILAIGMLLSLDMGLAGGLLPAISAMRLKPLDSVR